MPGNETRPLSTPLCIPMPTFTTYTRTVWVTTVSGSLRNRTQGPNEQNVPSVTVFRTASPQTMPTNSDHQNDSGFRPSSDIRTQVGPLDFWTGCSPTVVGTVTETLYISEAAYPAGPMKTKSELYETIPRPPVYVAATRSSPSSITTTSPRPLIPPPVFQSPGYNPFYPSLKTPAVVPQPVETNPAASSSSDNLDKPDTRPGTAPNHIDAPAQIQKPGATDSVPLAL